MLVLDWHLNMLWFLKPVWNFVVNQIYWIVQLTVKLFRMAYIVYFLFLVQRGEARQASYSHQGCLNCKMTLSYRFLSKYLNIGQYKVFEMDLTVRVRDLNKSTPRHAIYLRSNFDLLIVFVAVYLSHIWKLYFFHSTKYDLLLITLRLNPAWIKSNMARRVTTQNHWKSFNFLLNAIFL